MERLELCDERGRPLGRERPRELVHRDGDWHRAFHCWVVTQRPPHPLSGRQRGDFGGGQAPALRVRGPHLVLQRRSLEKETWPGLWDVSVGGHYRAGEGIDGGLREIGEELGLVVCAEELLHVGWRREEVFYPNGLIEREIQDMYFLHRDVQAVELRPEPAEVTAVALVPAWAIGPLSAGRLESIQASGAELDPRGHLAEALFTLRPPELVPRAGDYYGKIGRFAQRWAEAPGRVRRRWW